MKKKQKIIWGIAAILVISLITFLGVKKLTEPTLQERQITFLKNHETEMTTYIKKELPGTNKIKYYWDEIRITKGELFENQSLAVNFDDLNHLVKNPANGKTIHRAIYVTTDIHELKSIQKLTLYYPGGKGANK